MRRRPPEFIAGDAFVLLLIGGIAGIALANLTRVEATGVIIVLAILWWTGWPWFLQRRDHRLTILRSLAAASNETYEEAVADLFRNRGYVQVHQSKSDPSDIRCLDRAGQKVLVRAKRPSPGRRIGSQEMKRFIREVRTHHGADRGIVVTTTTFTPTAYSLARKARIGLMEGRQLVQALASEDGDHHVFDRHLHKHPEPRWTFQDFIHWVVVLLLIGFGLALWIGPTVRALRP
jgi:Restriction endonuclease